MLFVQQTASGTRSIFASGLSRPAGLAFDSAGNLYEADNGSGNIYEFSPDGTRSTFGSAFLGPVGLAFDSAGNLFAGYSGNQSIYRFTPSGTPGLFASGVQVPVGLAFDSAGNLCVAIDSDHNVGDIFTYTSGGTRSTFASFPAVNQPQGLVFDNSGNLYAADSSNIYKFSPNGTRSTFASGLSGPEFLAYEPQLAPEPSTCVLLGLGAAGLLIFRRRK
jgi:sugar lactone lactonase YvrE